MITNRLEGMLPAMVKMPRPGDIPPVTFKNFVTELASTALVCLGHIENPVLKRKGVDRPRAEHIIGLLIMLEEKTRGNLEDSDSQYLQMVIADLQVKLEETPQEAP